MQQYYRFKRQHPLCVLMFRIGDFYEMFDEDAVTVSKAIGLTLTRRTEGMPMCGVPFHQLESYLRRLMAAGFRVAVCEQLADASQVKGLIPRGVTRVVTPGTAVDETLLQGDATSTLAAVIFTASGDDSPASLAIVEVSTGDFVVVDCTPVQLVDELARRGARELLFADPGIGEVPVRVKRLLDALGIAGTPRPTWQFRLEEASQALREHFGVKTFAGFGIGDEEPVLQAAGAIVRYLKETQTLSEDDAKLAANFVAGGAGRATLKHLRPPRREDASRTCIIDAVSLRSLEIERTIRGKGTADGSLLGIFMNSGSCRTAMGKRLLRDYLCHPLREITDIEARQDCVGALMDERVVAGHAAACLEHVQDVARIAGRVAMARCTPRDLVGLARSIEAAAKLVEILDQSAAFSQLRSLLAPACEQTAAFAQAVLDGCVAEPPPHLRDGGLFKDGYDAELDEMRLLQKDAGTWLSEYQVRLIAKYPLPSLKVGYNSVFGYYIELPTAQARSAPPELVRKQTLKNAERFTTPELRDYEVKVMNAQQRGLDRERVLFNALCDQGAALLAAIAVIGDECGRVDVFSAFAEKAIRRGWKRPQIVEEPVLRIDGGRHPVLDETLGSEFVPNDVQLGVMKAEEGSADANPAKLALITGPNMAGKSTYIRQAALIALLAHTGSFVPADRAVIGKIDRIFTRIGADDALHAGQSTFMVEMIETANILNHATTSSLVVLDEVGRGTSTLDGLSLAWAIVEHLAGETQPEYAPDEMADGAAPPPTPPKSGPRTLFATHYHELTDLEERFAGRVKNLHVSVREWPAGDGHAEIVFLHRILPGKTDQSYGLHVARLAGIPAGVVSRGREVLATLAVHHMGGATSDSKAGTADGGTNANGKLNTRNISTPKAVEKGRGGGGGGVAQLALFKEYVQHPAVDAIREMKIDLLSPMQAFDELRKLKDLVDA